MWKYREDLNHQIWDITTIAFYEDAKIDYIKIEMIEDKMMIIPYNEESGIKVHCTLGENKTKSIISKILNKDFRKKLKDIQKNYNDLRIEFKEKFQKPLDKLIHNINNNKEDLKGKCDKCSFWGDC